MFYYKQMNFTVLYVDEYGNEKKTYIRADDDEQAAEKADGLLNRYDWRLIIEIWRS